MWLLPEVPGTRPREVGCGWLECELAKTLLWFVTTPEPRPACPVAPRPSSTPCLHTGTGNPDGQSCLGVLRPAWERR